MPFIFHEEKKSIFDPRPSKVPEQQIKNEQDLLKKHHRNPFNFRVSVNISKQHPFRGKKQNSDENDQRNEWVSLNKKILTHSDQGSNKKSQGYQNVRKGTSLNSNQKRCSQQTEHTEDTVFQHSFSSRQLAVLGKVNFSGEQQKQLQVKKDRQHKISKKFGENSTADREKARMNFATNQNPGPGAYKTQDFSSVKSGFIQPAESYCVLLRKQKELPLLETENFKDQTKNHINMSFSYKNKASAVFQSQNKDSHNKSKAKLMSLIMNRNLKQKDLNQKQVENTTVADSIQSQREIESNCGNLSKQFQEEFEPIKQSMPNACSYEAKSSLEGSLHTFNSKNLPFMSLTEKFSNGIYSKNQSNQNFSKSSFGGRVVAQGTQGEHPEGLHILHGNPKGEIYSIVDKHADKKRLKQQPHQCSIFKSSVPRQLRFDTEKLCQQEFYYSPKNEMLDAVEGKISACSRNMKYQFGSSLERFKQISTIQEDRYSKVNDSSFFHKKHSQEGQNAVFKSELKREPFAALSNNVPFCNEADPSVDSVSHKVQRETLKKLIQSKYKDQVTLLKQKKKIMNGHIAAKRKDMMDIETTQPQFDEVDLDLFKNTELQRKWKEKANISFGSDKNKLLKRCFERRRQLDRYYKVEPEWGLKSFNRNYGFEKEQI